MAERAGAVDSCLVLRAGFVLRGSKEKREEKNPIVYITVISARAHFLFTTTERIFERKMGLGCELV